MSDLPRTIQATVEFSLTKATTGEMERRTVTGKLVVVEYPDHDEDPIEFIIVEDGTGMHHHFDSTHVRGGWVTIPLRSFLEMAQTLGMTEEGDDEPD